MNQYSRALEYLNEDDINALRGLLSTYPELVNLQEQDSEKTLLHYACEGGLTAITEMLLYDFNADPLLVSFNDDFLADALPIHYAAYFDHCGCLLLLLRHRKMIKMINETDGLGLTPLFEAIINRSYNVLEVLFSNQYCDVNADVESGGVGADRANVDIPDETTPLCALILLGEEDVALELLETRDEVDIDEGFPLHLAAKYGMSSLVEKLLEMGVDLPLEDIEGRPVPCYEISPDEKERPPLYYAVKKGHLDVVSVFYRYAKKHNRYVGENYRDGVERCSLLHWAVDNKMAEIAHYLMWFPRINFEVKDASGLTAFALAVRKECVEIVDLFKRKFHADPNRRLPSISRCRKKSKLHAELSSDIDPFSATLLLGEESEESGDELAEFMLSQASEEEADSDDGKLLMTVAAQKSDRTLEAYLSHSALRSRTIEDALAENNEDIAPEKEVKVTEKAAVIRQDEDNISDASDSDDDDFAPEPTKTLIPEAIRRSSVCRQQLVPNYRGEQYGQGKEKKEERKHKRDRDPTQYGLHSLASGDLLKKKFREKDIPKNTDDEEKLSLYDVMVNQEMRKMQETPYTGKKNNKAKKKPRTDSDADFQSYIHRYDAHLDELAGEDGDAENTTRIKKYQFSFAKNPNLSFSGLPKVGFKFATGLNAASDRVVNRIKVRSTGQVHNPFVGEVFVVLHTPVQLQNNGSEHAPTLYNQGRLGLSLVYRHAYERRFLGGIPKEAFLEKVVIKIPSFDEYLPHYQEKYGLSSEEFLAYQEELTNADNQEEVDAVIKKFLAFLMTHLDSQIEQYAIDTAELENANIVHDDWNGGFSPDQPKF